MSILSSKTTLDYIYYVTFDNKIMRIGCKKNRIEILKIIDSHKCEIIDIQCIAKYIFFLDEYGRLFYIFENYYGTKMVKNYCFKKIVSINNGIFCVNENDNIVILKLCDNKLIEKKCEYKYFSKDVEFSTLNEIDWDAAKIIKGTKFIVEYNEYFYIFDFVSRDKINVTKINKIEYDYICIKSHGIIIENKNGAYSYRGNYLEHKKTCSINRNINDGVHNPIDFCTISNKTYLYNGLSNSPQFEIYFYEKIDNPDMMYQEIYFNSRRCLIHDFNVIYLNHEKMCITGREMFNPLSKLTAFHHFFEEDNVEIICKEI